MTSIDDAELETKPTTFARGVPKEAHNGFYGIEDQLLDMPIDTQITAVVTYRLDDVISKLGKGVQYPVISPDHIEPIWDEKLLAQAKAAQVAQYKKRTGENTLDFGDDD